MCQCPLRRRFSGTYKVFHDGNLTSKAGRTGEAVRSFQRPDHYCTRPDTEQEVGKDQQP